ncbi:acyl-CoA dehydrogenase family protein [Mycolicibacterium litorale]|uniref:acyl-CoA dehydrogenase family protein n=1 Tax=Mycolicibacterium litorale TaxID=758802 RepID=UPI003CF964F4
MEKQAMSKASQTDLSPKLAVERAKALRPLLIEEQAATEARTFYSSELHQKLVAAGLFELTHPRKYGGYEFGLDTFFRVVVEISRGCGSSGMLYALAAGHTIGLAAYWPEQVQEEVLGQGPFIAPLTVEPELTAEKVDGGWRLNGTVSLCTGAPYANYFWGHATTDARTADGEPIEILEVLVPSSEWTMLDDWHGTLGMRGSGSQSLKIDNGFIADRFAVENSYNLGYELKDGSTPGARLHGNSLYVGRPSGWFSTSFTAIAVGLAHAAVDAYGELMQTEGTKIPPIISRKQDDEYLSWYGDGIGRAAAADGMLSAAVQHMQQKAEAGDFTVEDDLLVTRLSLETVSHCYETVHRLIRTAGPEHIRYGTRIERVYRDISQLYFHDGYILECDTAARDLARLRLGVPAPKGARTLIG